MVEAMMLFHLYNSCMIYLRMIHGKGDLELYGIVNSLESKFNPGIM